LVRSELDAYKEVADMPKNTIKHKKLVIGEMIRAKAIMTITGFALAEVFNQAMRGKHIWENPEEDRKWQAYLGNYGGHDYWFDPWFMSMPISAMIKRYMKTGQSLDQAALRVVQNKTSAIIRAARVATEGQSSEGKPLFSFWERAGAAASELAPIPITLREALKDEEAGYVRQIFATAGIDPEKQGAVSPSAKAIKHEDYNLAKAARFIANTAVRDKNPKVIPELVKDFPQFNQARLRQIATTMWMRSHMANRQAEMRAERGMPARAAPRE
jgi:hypothetical protein